MSSTASIQKGTQKHLQKTMKKSKGISWEAFQREYLTREDGYKYEWLDGKIEKTKRTMDYSQIYILKNLINLFNELKNAGKVKGFLISEVDTFFSSHHRRPDIAFFTDEQIAAAKEGNAPVPEFVIEIISKNDKLNQVNKKMEDYRNAKVPVVWHILPDFKGVHVYRGTKMNIYKGKEIISVDPVLPDFKITVEAIFA